MFVITEREGRTIVRKTQVVPGLSEGGFVEIKEGVRPGERLAADGLNRLQDGQPVSLPGQRPPGAPGAAQGKGPR